MKPHTDLWIARANTSLARAFVPEGILASEKAVDNYQRVWARDGIMAGIYGLITGDAALVEQLRLTLLGLALKQAPNGQIPSSIGLGNHTSASYGSLAGRIDATLWWLIGSALFIKHQNDQHFAQQHEATVQKLLHLLKAWEYNQADLIYTPLGGNWADEYVTHGHTLYDNSLRVWALQLVANIWPHLLSTEEAQRVVQKVKATFNTQPNPNRYHPEAYKRLQKRLPGYCFAACGPYGYDTRWDAMGNAFALLCGINQNAAGIAEQVNWFLAEHPSQLIPAFWPVIRPRSTDWPLLAVQFTHRFKNPPHHFHNGGSWPIANGWLALGLSLHGFQNIAVQLLEQFTNLLQENGISSAFAEYYAGDTKAPGGVAPLTYSATGLLLMAAAVESNPKRIKTFFQ